MYYLFEKLKNLLEFKSLIRTMYYLVEKLSWITFGYIHQHERSAW